MAILIGFVKPGRQRAAVMVPPWWQTGFEAFELSLNDLQERCTWIWTKAFLTPVAAQPVLAGDPVCALHCWCYCHWSTKSNLCAAPGPVGTGFLCVCWHAYADSAHPHQSRCKRRAASWPDWVCWNRSAGKGCVAEGAYRLLSYWNHFCRPVHWSPLCALTPVQIQK